MNPRLWFIAGLMAFGCGGDGVALGLAGCESMPSPVPFPRSELNTIERGTTVTLTAAGSDFLLAERELIAGLLLDVDPDGWVRLDIPDQEVGDDRLGLGLRDLTVAFDLRAAIIDLRFVGDPPRIRLSVEEARLRFESGNIWIGVGGNGACTLENGVFRGQPNAHFVTASLTVDLFPEVDAEGRLRLQVGVDTPTISDLDIELGVDPNLPECADLGSALECDIACGASDLAADIAELLYDLFSEQLNALLTPFVEQIVNDLATDFTDKPLAIEGAIGPAALAALLPLRLDAHALQFRVAPSPEGFSLRTAGEQGDGLGMTLDVGLETLDHPCVPPTNRAPLLDAGPAPVLTGYDHLGEVYHVGASIADATLNRLLWTVWRSGLLCLALDTDDIEDLAGQRIDTSTLGLFLPGLERLATGPRPMMIVLDPRPPVDAFPLLTLQPVAEDGGVPQAGLSVNVPALGIEIYAHLEDRWTRVFAARTDVAADLVVQATPDNQLALTIEPPSIGELAVEYEALVESDDLPALLSLVLDVASRALLTDALAFDVGLDGLVEQATGLPYDARIAALRIDGPMDDHLSVLTTLSRAGAQALAGRVDTAARLVKRDGDTITVAVEALGAREGRFQHRLDGGPWRPLRAAPDGLLVITDPLLRVPGTHRLDVRAVAAGAYETLDDRPAVVQIVTAATDPLENPAAEAPSGVPAPRSGVDACATLPGAPAPTGWLLVALGAMLFGRRRRS